MTNSERKDYGLTVKKECNKGRACGDVNFHTMSCPYCGVLLAMVYPMVLFTQKSETITCSNCGKQFGVKLQVVTDGERENLAKEMGM